MQMQTSRWLNYQALVRPKAVAGFTLVELLIVIVIIAILAAITIVAFNGIQARAQISQQQADLTQAAKQFEMFNSINGNYPASIADAAGMKIKFSFSPVGSNVLLCYSSSGYAIFERLSTSSADGQYIINGQAPAATSTLFPGAKTGNYWSGGILCPKTPYSSSAWGSTWVSGS